MSSATAHYVLGAGRWGSWLARRLWTCGFGLDAILGERASSRRLAEELGVPNVAEPQASDAIVWVCVSDAHIAEVFARASTWCHRPLGLVHASGTHGLPTGEAIPFGVCWPVQGITAELEPDWHTLPLVIEATDAAFAKTLYDVASRLSGLPPKRVTDSLDRRRLHLAATLAQNFGNLLWTLAEEVLAKADPRGSGAELDYRELLPLAQNHLHKLATVPPSRLQTGPAARGDASTLAQHRALLADAPDALAVYDALTAAITRRHRP